MLPPHMFKVDLMNNFKLLVLRLSPEEMANLWLGLVESGRLLLVVLRLGEDERQLGQHPVQAVCRQGIAYNVYEMSSPT